MTHFSPDVQRRIDQHLDAVDNALASAGLARDERSAIVADVQGQIADMLATRVPATAKVEDVEDVLISLDPPEAYVIALKSGESDAGGRWPSAIATCIAVLLLNAGLVWAFIAWRGWSNLDRHVHDLTALQFLAALALLDVLLIPSLWEAMGRLVRGTSIPPLLLQTFRSPFQSGALGLILAIFGLALPFLLATGALQATHVFWDRVAMLVMAIEGAAIACALGAYRRPLGKPAVLLAFTSLLGAGCVVILHPLLTS